MSSTAHFIVFWMAGLLTGTLLGWMLGGRAATAARQPNGRELAAEQQRRG